MDGLARIVPVRHRPDPSPDRPARPADAAKVNEQTMVFSYLVGITRPVGGLLLGLLFAALLSLPVEAATGISFRSEILALFGQ